MKKYQYLASWDDQTLTRVGEPVVVLGDSNVSQVEVILPSNFLLDPTKAECRMYFLLPGEKESDHDVLEPAVKDDNGDSHVTWTIKHAHTQKGGRLAFSLTLIGDDAQWDSRTAIIPVYESRYQPESEEAEEPYTGRLDALEGSMAAIRGEFAEVQEDFEDLKETATLGTPIPESLVANMQEGHVYIYTGTEPGYTAGHVYYYVGGALTDGGLYGGTSVDTTLTVSGAAADAKVTGDKIAEIKEDLTVIGYVAPASGRYTGNNLLPNPLHENKTVAGVTYTWNESTSSWTITGTSTGTSFDNLYNGLNNLSLPDGIVSGGTYYIEHEPSDNNIYIEYLWYDADKTLISSNYTSNNAYMTVPENAAGCIIRLKVFSGNTVNGTTVNPKIYLATDNTNDIINALTVNGRCSLGKGNYYINNLVMPNDTTIYGIGDGTVIHIIYEYNKVSYAISPTSGCSINNVTIIGTDNPLAFRKGLMNGIEINGAVLSAIRLCNLTIYNCNRYGINVESTGGTTDGGVIIENSKIYNCWSGIYFTPNSEYNKVSNCIIRNCFRGCINNGGNNTFTNTTFHGVVGFLIEGESSNSGHGTCVGCTFNHIDNIANPDTLGGGRAISISALTNGFIFDGCQFWYGAIFLSNSRGVTICNSQMGDGKQNPHITVTGSYPAFFNNIIFHQTPIISDSASSKFTACYLDSDGSAVTGQAT